jgi:hypothetical protein
MIHALKAVVPEGKCGLGLILVARNTKPIPEAKRKKIIAEIGIEIKITFFFFTNVFSLDQEGIEGNLRFPPVFCLPPEA